MKRLDERGNVLLYTLVGSIVATVLAVGIAQMLMSRASVSAKVTAQTAAQRQAEATLSVVFNDWNVNGLCHVPTGFSCSGSCTATVCGCTIYPTGCTCVDGGNPSNPTAGTNSDPGRCLAAVVTAVSGATCKISAKTCP